MSLNEYNQKAINDIYKNAHLALQSISDILDGVDDVNMKTELKSQYDGYDKMIVKISVFMKEKGLEPKDANFFQKNMMKMSIKMKTLVNNSLNQIADMMIKGTVMGINELYAMKNEESNLDDGVKELLNELLKLEEDFNEKLKKFL